MILNSFAEEFHNREVEQYGEKVASSLGLKRESKAKNEYVTWMESHKIMSFTQSDNISEIFDEMYNLISEANRIPLTDKIIIEESDLAGILDDLKEAIPKEVKSATRLLEEQKAIVTKAHEEADNIVLQAKTEADRILELAKSESERLMRQEEISKQAEAFAEDVKSTALRNQQEMKDEADAYVERVKHDVLQYADDMLGYLSGSLQSALQAVNDNRASVNAERESVMSSRPQRDMELLAMEEEEDEE